MKILVVKTSSMGDVIHALPAITDAKKAIFDLEIDWVVEEAFCEIPKMHSGISRVISVAFRRWRSNIFNHQNFAEIKFFLKDLRKTNYDLIIDAQGLIKSALLSLLAKGKRCGFDRKSIREPIASFFYNKKLTISKNQHAIKRVRELFSKVLDYNLELDGPDYGLKKDNFISKNFGENYLVFIHGTSRPEKCWQEQKWIELAKLATNKGYLVYLTWGNEEELGRAERIRNKNENIKIFAKSNLFEIAKLINNATGVVAVDTGLSHLAAALDVPCVSLYGPTDVNLIGTVGQNQKHLQNFNNIVALDVWNELKQLIMKN